MSRYRPMAGHVMIELLYGVGEHLNRANDAVVGNITQMSKVMHNRPNKLIGALEWLHIQGLLKSLSVGRYEFSAVLKQPEGLSKEEPVVVESTPKVVVMDLECNNGWWD